MEALVRRGEELTYCDWLGKPIVDEENSFFRRCSLKRERERGRFQTGTKMTSI